MAGKRGYYYSKKHRRYMRKSKKYWYKHNRFGHTRGLSTLANRTLLGNSIRTTLRYADTFNVQTPTLGLPLGKVYRANGMFDPDVTATGHQPRGFDQLMLLFQHFTVIGSKCMAWFSHAGGAASDPNPVICMVDLRSAGGQLTGFDYNESRNVKWKCKSTNSDSVVVTKNFSPKSFFPTNNVIDDPNQKGTAAIDPLEEAFFHVQIQSSNPSNQANTNISVYVVIDYIAVFREPRGPPES